MNILLVVAAVCLQVQSVPNLESVKEQWESFKLKYGKQYSTETEENFRMKIFMDKLHMIETHNERYQEGLVSYSLAINKFGDRLLHEITNGRLNKFIQDEEGTTFIEPENVVPPDSIDWREKGAVTPVKDQKECGSCYCFSTTGSIEGQHFLKTKNLVNLSEQNLVDCTEPYGNHGCGGGFMVNNFRYIIKNKGIDTEKSYPYEGNDEGECRYNPKTVGATVKDYVKIKTGSEKQLQVAVATIGPVSVGIDSQFIGFWNYHHGVYDEPDCGNTQKDLDHAVLVVGYGTTNDSKQYWIVKNSNGADWGDKGYILMSRNKNNQCGIATSASYPLV